MKSLIHATLVLTSLTAGQKTWNFENDALDQLPTGWKEARTGDGPGSVWRVVADPTTADGRRVLAQTSADGPNRMFNLCIEQSAAYDDLELAVDLRAVAGKLDQGGGLVWRLQDENNYYIARWNPLEDNFRVYKVIEGKRQQLTTVDVKISVDQWHTLRIVMQADRIQCYLDGKLHLDVRDDAIRKPGKIGLWSKADAVTHFDNLRAAALAGS